MTLQELQKDMIAAMKAKDKVKKDAISSLIAAVPKMILDDFRHDSDYLETYAHRDAQIWQLLFSEYTECCPSNGVFISRLAQSLRKTAQRKEISMQNAVRAKEA